MNYVELFQILSNLLSVLFAAKSGGKWYDASKVEMPHKTPICPELPGMNRVTLMGEDYAITFARINEALNRLDESLVKINESAALNKAAASYAVWAALFIAVSLTLPMAAQVWRL